MIYLCFAHLIACMILAFFFDPSDPQAVICRIKCSMASYVIKIIIIIPFVLNYFYYSFLFL